MKKLILLLGLLLMTVLFNCTSEKKNPSGSIFTPLNVTDACDNPIGLNFNVEVASLIPIPKEDLTFENLGLSGAESLVNNLKSEETFCTLDISDEIKSLFQEVEQLITDGKNSEARNLLKTLLGTGKFIVNTNSKLNHTKYFLSDVHQKVRELLRAAGYDQNAGGDGESYMDQARNDYSNWGGEAIKNATVKELIKIAGEAAILGLDDLKDSALNKALEKIKNDLIEKIKSFDPCTATLDDGKELLETLAKEELLGGRSDSHQEVLDKLGQSAIKLGADTQVVHQHLGDHIEAPTCSFMFEWNRTVSDGWIFVGEGYSCDGINWEGTVNLSGTNSTGASISSNGTFIFATAEGSNSAQTTIQTSGTMTISGDALSFTDPLPMNFVFLKDDLQAEITIASDGSGSMPTPAGPIPFASVFTTEPKFQVDLTENPDCDN
jgi:hypothetical protein